MKFKFLSVLMLAGMSFTTQAQQVTVSPLPQEITWGEKAFDAGFSYTLSGEQDADTDALRVLKAKVPQGNGTAVKIVIGERGDASVASYTGKIPEKKEGYYLKVTPEEVIIAGNDGNGTFYGVQTFLQIASQPEVMQVEVTDYPDVIDRGVVEGFYGNPWSTTDRKRQFEFYGENKMNVYIYGPKDDPYHRAKWREPYPEAEAAVIKELVQSAHENKVQFVWALHPGNDIKWTEEDRKNVVNKLELMYAMGVRAFSLFFDDIGGEGTDPTRQSELVNYVTKNFINKYPELPPIIFCPTSYNRAWSGDGSYLRTIGSNMDKGVRIMWTGNSVVDMINKSDMDWINAQINRNAYIWLNYPTNDYCIDRMLMGPTYGNDLNIAGQLSGFTANPSEYAEASKVSLYSIADYTWNMTAYDSNASWERAIKYLMPEHAEAFHIFCEHNIDLGSTYHGLRRDNESKRFADDEAKFKTAIANGLNQEAFDLIRPHFDEMVAAAEELLSPELAKEPMTVEMTPWYQVMKLMGQRGQKLCSLYTAIAEDRPEDFIATYKEMIELETEQKAIRSRNFEGSIKSPNPTVSGTVISPFLKQYVGILIAEYKKHYSEGWENFPAVLIEDGKYYIKCNGKFLTNVSGSAFPTFVAEEDDINPQRQEWEITMDYNTNRYKIVNAQDQRYLNEKGEFTVSETTNPYEPVWHTYNITRLNGKYAIQNAGSAGNNYWTANATRISTGSSTAYTPDNFIFELVPLNSSEPEAYPTIINGGAYYIVNPADGKYLTSISGDNIPKFQEPKVEDASQNQSWTFSIEPATNRYKIVNVADNRNLNEMAQFGTAYGATWNTFIIQEMDGLFCIRCAGDAGTKFWEIANGRVQQGDKAESESYVFKLIEAPEPKPDEAANSVFYKRGLVTDASQIADGDYVVIQNVNTGNLNRQGYLYYADDSKFLTYLSGYYQTELSSMKSAFPDRYVFQVAKDDKGISFKNVTSGKYIPNDVASGAYVPTTDASKTKFLLESSSKADFSWKIKSAANGMYINGEPGYPVVWTDEHPMRIYKVAEIEDPATTTIPAWFRIGTTDGNTGVRMMLPADETILAMQNTQEGNRDETLWALEESPDIAGRYTLINKAHTTGSVDWQTTTITEALMSQFGYSEDKDYGIYVKTTSTEALPAWTMYRVNGGSSLKRFIHHNGNLVEETADPQATGRNWKLIPTVSLQSVRSGLAVGAFSAPVATAIPEGVLVYAAVAKTESQVTLKALSGTVLPANMPVIVAASEAGVYEMTPTDATTDVVKAETNLLSATAGYSLLAPADALTLNFMDDEAVFNIAKTGDPLAAYSVYLKDTTQGSKTLFFDQMPPTSVDQIEAGISGENTVYDLSGRRVVNPTKGVYIQNGQKIIVK